MHNTSALRQKRRIVNIPRIICRVTSSTDKTTGSLSRHSSAFNYTPGACKFLASGLIPTPGTPTAAPFFRPGAPETSAESRPADAQLIGSVAACVTGRKKTAEVALSPANCTASPPGAAVGTRAGAPPRVIRSDRIIAGVDLRSVLHPSRAS